MAGNPFENFIQVELPLRPFLPSDVEQESIIVRRGQGPRQMSGVKLTNGQFLGMVDGVLQGVEQKPIGTPVDAVIFAQAEASDVWTVQHNRNNVNVLVQLYGTDGKVFDPDAITVAANTVTISLYEAAAGRVVLLFIPEPEAEAQPT